MSREEAARAIREGREAGTRGDRPTVCPYPATSLLRSAWVRGYAKTAPRPTNNGSSS